MNENVFLFHPAGRLGGRAGPRAGPPPGPNALRRAGRVRQGGDDPQATALQGRQGTGGGTTLRTTVICTSILDSLLISGGLEKATFWYTKL